MTTYEDEDGKKRSSLSLIQRKTLRRLLLNVATLTIYIGDVEVLRRPAPKTEGDATESTHGAQAHAA
jgi:hypothetical protein